MWVNPNDTIERSKQPSPNYIPAFSAEQASNSASASTIRPAVETTRKSTQPPSNDFKHKHFKHTTQSRSICIPQKLCLLFYAVGCLVSGFLLAALTQEEQLILLAYCQRLFPSHNLHLLRYFFSLMIPAILQIIPILLFGFCAFGAPLIAGTIVLSGIASGTFAFMWLNQYKLPGLLYYIVSLGLYQALLAVTVCHLGQRGIIISTKLFSQIFSRKAQTEQRFNLYFAKRFLRYTFATIGFSLIACSLSTAIIFLSQTLLPTV